MTSLDIALGIFALIGVVAAVLAVVATRVVHAALWLVVTVVSSAGAILVLGNELVGLAYVLIYVGAVVVLMLFAIMLTRAPMGPDLAHAPHTGRIAVSALAGAATTGVILSALWPILTEGESERHLADTALVAQRIFGTWLWPFELLSLLLLAALVAALALSRVGVVDRAPQTRMSRNAGGAR